MDIGTIVRYLGRQYVVIDISWEDGVLKLQISLRFGDAKRDLEWVHADDVEVI